MSTVVKIKKMVSKLEKYLNLFRFNLTNVIINCNRFIVLFFYPGSHEPAETAKSVTDRRDYTPKNSQ